MANGLSAAQQRELDNVNYYNSLDPSATVKDDSFYGGNLGGYPAWVYSDPQLADLSRQVGTGDATQAQVDARAKEVYALGSKDAVAQSNLNQYKDAANQAYQFTLQHPSGFNDDFMDKFMGTVFPAVVGTFMGAGATGLLGDLGGASAAAGSGASSVAGATAADMGLGSIPINSSLLGDTGWMSSIAGGADAGLGGSAAVGGSSLAGLSGTGGASSELGLGTTGISIPESSLPGLTQPTLNAMPAISNAEVMGGAAGSTTTGGSGFLSTLQDANSALNGISKIGSAISDYGKNNANADYYQNLMNQASSFYAPGSPEATLMEKQMDAKDAAAGRNSQYGVRATNLAGVLAQQRANILANPTYAKYAEASRAGTTNNLNSIFSTLGSAGNLASSASSIGNTISKGWSSLSSLFG